MSKTLASLVFLLSTLFLLAQTETTTVTETVTVTSTVTQTLTVYIKEVVQHGWEPQTIVYVFAACLVVFLVIRGLWRWIAERF